MTENKVTNTAQLRSVLLDVIGDLRSKTIEPVAARAIASITKEVLSSAKLDLLAMRTKEELGKVDSTTLTSASGNTLALS